jgi:crotonobetainyl-CoA:carnitine CoA-transferase CaiB-like acyl-CoA transferase
MVENFRSGVTERFGLDYESVRRDNPGVIYCSITGFGRGKGAILPGYDLLIQAVGGLMSITGSPDGEPQKVGVALVDVLAGLFSAVGILAALEYRRRSGEGQRIEVDLLSALLGGLVNQASAYTVAGVVPERMGNRHPSIAPYEPLRCADRELVLAVGNDRQFAMLCDVLGVPELARDPRFAVNAARVENRDALHGALEERLRTREASAWAAALSEAGVPAGVVNDIAAAFELARELGLAPVVPVGRDDGTTVELTRNPIGLSVTPPSYRSAPPRFPGPN